MVFRLSFKNVLFILALLVLLGAAGTTLYGSYWSQPTYITSVETSLDPTAKQTILQRIELTKAGIAAQEADPGEDQIFLYTNLASDYLMVGDLQNAADTYETYLTEKNTIDYVAWNNYANVLERMQNYVAAEQAYRKAIALDAAEEYYRDYIVFLQTHFKQERRDEILAVLEEGMEQTGRTRWFLVTTARWYTEAGDCTQADAHYKVALQVEEDEAIKESIEKEREEAKEECKQ